MDYIVASDPTYISVKSFKFGDDYLTNSDLEELQRGLIRKYTEIYSFY